MGLVFNGLIYLSGYLFLIFVAVCLVCGLYYLAELSEEHTSLTKRIMAMAIYVVLAVHALCFVLEPHLPWMPLGAGIGAHACYLLMMRSFPFIQPISAAALAGFALLLAQHYLWWDFFSSHYHQVTHVLCFLIFNAWLVPFGFFVTISVNESTLPDRQAASAAEVYSAGGERTKQKSGLLSAFSALQQKRDDAFPGMGEKV